MVADWYYAKDGERFGPFEAQQIKQFAAQGVLRPTDSVTRKGMPQWMPAHTVKGLFAEPPPITPQAPAADEEVTLYKDDDIVVTTRRVVLGDTVLLVRDIVSARVVRRLDWALANAISTYCCAGFSLLVGLGTLLSLIGNALSGETVDTTTALGCGLGSVALSVLCWLRARELLRKCLWQLAIQTNQEKLELLGSHDPNHAADVADAIKKAMPMGTAR